MLIHSSSYRIFMRDLALLVCVFLPVRLAIAQVPTATLVGQVFDSSKAVIPGATVQIRDTATNQIRTTQTGTQGDYTISNLNAGDFDVTISKPGFQTMHETQLVLAADQTARLDATLLIGKATETVDVSSSAGLLNTDNSTLGNVITPLETMEIPLNGRDFNDLAFTVAGVQPAEQKAKGAPYVANGSRADSSGVYIDGINDESPRDAGAQIKPPLDSIQEFRMETSDYAAQYGRLSGSVVNMVTKRGSNQFHGSLFDFIRNDYLDATPFDFSTIPIVKTKLRQNDFGGDFSGPIIIPHIYNGHNRTFFSLSLESFRNVEGTNSYGIVPSQLERTGDFSQSNTGGTPYYFHNPAVSSKVACAPPAPPAIPTPSQVAGCLYPAPYDQIPELDSVAKKLLSYYPLPNIPGALPGVDNYVVQTNSINNYNNGLLRIDEMLTSRDQVSGRFLRDFNVATKPTAGSDLGTFGTATAVHETLIGVQYTRVFTPSLVNAFAYGRTRTVSDESSNDAGTNYALQLGIPDTTTIPSLEDFPSFKPSGYETIGDDASTPISYVVNDYDGSDLVTWTHGKNTFKFGGDILHVQLFQPTNTDKNGAFTYDGKFTDTGHSNALADLFAGYPASSILMTGGNTNHLIQTNYAGFAQDDFNATDRLTLNLGLRYELQTLPAEENGQLSNFVPSLGKIVYTNASAVPNISSILAQSGLTNYYISAADAGYPAALIHTNNLRFSPRVGFAYRPFNNDKTVIRGGYGIFYTGIRLTVIRTNLAGQYPFSATTTYSAVSPSSKGAGSNFISPTNPFPQSGGSLKGILTPNGYDPNAPSGNLQSYNLTIERALGWKMTLELSYAGSKGTHLPQEEDFNQERTEDVNSSRPFPIFSAITMMNFNGPSNYNSGQVTLKKLLQHGLFFRANYTYAKSLDEQSGANYAGGGGYSMFQNVLNPSAEYGRSDFDIRHNFTVAVVYRTGSRSYFLRDWQVSGDVLAYSGQPFTVKVSGNQDLGQPTRPNQLCNGTLSHRTLSEWFNPACYATPPAGTFGNTGRNTLSGPDRVTVNLAVARIFTLPHRFGSFEFRLEGFNALNHPSFGYPTSIVESTKTAGVISSTTGNQRLVQISGRYTF